MAAATLAAAALSAAVPRWEGVASTAEPGIGPEQTLPHGVYQGFETGQYIKAGGKHYYVANELGLCPHVRWDFSTRAALWTAPSGAGPWSRVTTLRNTSSMYSECQLDEGRGLKNKWSWAPTLLFGPSTANGTEPVWNFFYSGGEAARFKPGDGILHAVSTTASIEGPYVDLGLVSQPSHSFNAWRLPNGTYMSFRNNVPGFKEFSIGLERIGSVLGARTVYDNNSVPFPCGPENPIVSRSADGQWYYAVYDALEQLPVASRQGGQRAAAGEGTAASGCGNKGFRSLCTNKTQCDQVGIAWSPDGVTWTADATALLRVQTDDSLAQCPLSNKFGAAPADCARRTLL